MQYAKFIDIKIVNVWYDIVTTSQLLVKDKYRQYF